MNSVSSVAGIRPPATTVARLRCTSLPTPVASAAGNMPTVATVAVISTGRNRSPAPASTASSKRHALLAHAIEVRHHDDAVHHRDAEQRDEADARRDVERHAGDMQRDQSAERRQRHDTDDQEDLAQHAEFGIEQHHHGRQHQADDQPEARLGALLAFELAAPFDVIFAAGRTKPFASIAL